MNDRLHREFRPRHAPPDPVSIYSIYIECLATTPKGKSLLRSLCGSFLSRKDPHLPTFGQKRQYPLQHHEESVREPDQEIDVHDRPDNPRGKSGESEHAKIG